MKKWIDVSRFVYNKTVEKLKKETDKTPTWMFYWKDVIALELPGWCDNVPFQIKKIAVRDAINSLKEGKKRVKRGMIPRFEQSFRSRKNPQQSCFIPSSAIKKQEFIQEFQVKVCVIQNLYLSPLWIHI